MKKKWIYLIVGSLLILIISGGVYYLIKENKSKAEGTEGFTVPEGHTVIAITDFKLTDNFSFNKDFDIYIEFEDAYGIIYNSKTLLATRNANGKAEKDPKKIAEVVVSVPEDMFRLMYTANVLEDATFYLVNDKQEFKLDKELLDFTQIKEYIDSRTTTIP